MADEEKDVWPTEIRVLKGGSGLLVTFENGESYEMSAEYLRVESPSAEVQGHGPGERKTVPGKKDVAIMKVEPVGNYAVKLIFDDMHDTGLYSWQYLRQLGRERETRWQGYLTELAARGLSREPMRPGA